MLVVAIISTIAAFAMPGLLRARMTANEASAIASLRGTAVAQVAYATACGNGAYADSFVILGSPLTPGGEAFISADLGGSATPQKSGYNFTLDKGAAAAAGLDCQGRTTDKGYYATAVPQALGVSGNRSFAVDKANTIWQSTSAAPPSQPFTASSTDSTIQ